MANGAPQNEPTPPALAEIAEAIAGRIVSLENIERIWKGQENALVKVIEITLGLVIGLLGTLAGELALAIVNAEEVAEPAFKRLTAIALKDITGIETPELGGGGGREGRKPVARSVGAAILQAMSGGQVNAGPGASGVQPSMKPAEDYLTFVVQMALEGWLTGTVSEIATLGVVENLGDLDDSLARALGLQGVSSSVFRPVVDALVTTPAEWQINRTFRTKLLPPAEAARQFTRGRWTREQMIEELARQGYSDDRAEALLNAQRRFLTPADLQRAWNLGLMDHDQTVDHLRQQGYEIDTASLRMRLEAAAETLREEDQIGEAATAAYANRKISRAEFDAIVEVAVPNILQRSRHQRVAEARRAVNVKQISEGELVEAVKRNIRSIQDYERFLADEGFDQESIFTKVLLLRADIRDRDEAARVRAEAEERRRLEAEAKAAEDEEKRRKLEQERAISAAAPAQVREAAVRGLVDVEFYRRFLLSRDFTESDVGFLVAMLEEDRADFLEQLRKREEAAARAARRELNLGQLETAVLRGILTIGDYRARLQADGFDGGDVAVLAATLEGRLEEQRELEERRTRAEGELKGRGLSLGQAEEAVLRGIGTLEDFDRFLARENFIEFDRAVLLELLRRKIAERDELERRRAEQEAAKTAAGVPLESVRRAVLKGIRPRREYESALEDARIEASERVLLLELLDRELAELEDAKRRREEAEAASGRQAVSLAQLERGVLVGALTFDQYRAELVARGFDGPNVEILTALLLEQIREAALARQRREARELENTAAALTRGELERAVKAGLRQLADYRAELARQGYEGEDIEILAKLLELELAEAEEARRRREELAGELGPRALTLQQLERAVRLGERNLADYKAFLQDLGYAPIDVSTLVALMAREVEDEIRGRARREQLEAAASSRGLSLGQFERAVRGGLRTLDDYAIFLEDQGFTLDDVATLVGLLDQSIARGDLEEPPAEGP